MADPKKGTGKKPKGSGRRLYTDENPKDTVSIKFATIADAKATIAKVKRIIGKGSTTSESLEKPIFNTSIKNLAFRINAVGEFQNNQSNIRGSFDSSSFFLKSLSLSPNKGSFHYQSQKNIGILKLSEFLHPLIDEEYPIQINLKKKSLAVPKLFLSPQILRIKALNLSNLIIENLFLSFL